MRGNNNHTNWGKKSDKNEETRPGNIWPSYESDGERNCMAREQNNLAQWLDFTFLIPKDSKFSLVVKGSSDACGKTWLMSFFVYWKFHRYMNTRAAWNANIEESICDQKPIQFLLNEASVIVKTYYHPDSWGVQILKESNFSNFSQWYRWENQLTVIDSFRSHCWNRYQIKTLLTVSYV